jgi:methylene-fatty-acyl-phospholipid synthase
MPPVTMAIFVAAAMLLSLERICYVWIWHAPNAFRAVCAAVSPGEPVDRLRLLFYGFKLLQGAVFVGWCYVEGRGSLWPPDGGLASLIVGATLIATGQILNVSVFYRLGSVGMFYGRRFGYPVPWCREFPFTLFEHPQYVGALLSIWGFFLVMRFPHDDWYVLPALETLYYAVGARLEQ